VEHASTERVHFTVTPDERREIERAARAARKTISALIRDVMLATVRARSGGSRDGG
jgi:uncharacterized protein (DUF1778 family)